MRPTDGLKRYIIEKFKGKTSFPFYYASSLTPPSPLLKVPYKMEKREL